MSPSAYRGRLAPSPTGYLHLGHAATFWRAYERARERGGTLIFRNEDLDRPRCRAEFVEAMFEDLRWLGIEWQEGPDVGGPFAPYAQSQRMEHYRAAWQRLREGGWIYPCTCSRRELASAVSAPHDDNDEPLYPGTCRPAPAAGGPSVGPYPPARADRPASQVIAHQERRREPGAPTNWRFRVPDGELVEFRDERLGERGFVAGRDFGDFLVWRRDDLPSYQLAVVVDDAAMQVTEVVRGEDLLRSTARQLLLQRALGLPTPAYYHCELLTDQHGVRLAKRHDSLSLRELRRRGWHPGQLQTDEGRKKCAMENLQK